MSTNESARGGERERRTQTGLTPPHRNCTVNAVQGKTPTTVKDAVMGGRQKRFGKLLREKRKAKGFSLRKFAEMVGVSPTYLSQVEQGNIDPPTAERVKKMAELLGENADEFVGLAGRVPEDVPDLIQKRPTQMPELLRVASVLTAKQIAELTQQARRLDEENRKKK